jgi:hypothetical protein
MRRGIESRPAVRSFLHGSNHADALRPSQFPAILTPSMRRSGCSTFALAAGANGDIIFRLTPCVKGDPGKHGRNHDIFFAFKYVRKFEVPSI